MRDFTAPMHDMIRHRVFSGPLAAAIALALTLTSCGPDPTPPMMFSQLQARVSVLNKTREMHVLRVRNLRADVELDCERVAQDPDAFLTDDVFGAPTRWPLYSDQELGMGIDNTTPWQNGDDLGNRTCAASLIQSDTLDDVIIFWDDSLEPKTFQFDPNIPEHIKPDPQTVVLRGDYNNVDPGQIKPYRFRPCGEAQVCQPQDEAEAAEIPAGASYTWESVGEQKLHFERRWQPDDPPTQISDECEMPGASASIVFQQPLPGEWVVRRIDEGIDGCHSLELEAADNAQTQRSYLICAPIESLASVAPRESHDVVISTGLSSTPPGLRIRAEYASPEGYVDGTAHLYFTHGNGIPADLGIDARTAPRNGCEPVAAQCGQVDLPADVHLTETGRGSEVLRPGESVAFDDGERTLHLVRAFERTVFDRTCDDDLSDRLPGAGAQYIEAVSVIRY